MTRLAQYDVDIDAGADASDPENAVSFSLELPDGKTVNRPGNLLFFFTETALSRMLRHFGVDHMQGFLIGRPQPVVPA